MMSKIEVAAAGYFLLTLNNCLISNKAKVRKPKNRRWWIVSLHHSRARSDELFFEKVIGSLDSTFGFKKVEDDRPPLPTVILLHGLGGAHDTVCNRKIAAGLLQRGGFNIIAADYRHAFHGPSYEEAMANIDGVGKAVANFLLACQKDGSISLSWTTLIGFSLGAHVAGVAGYFVQENSAYLNKIIGLDPAKPGFANLSAENKLDSTDAGFVMVIHTAGGYLGIDEPIGHADFFPNGGKEIQPQCLGNELSSLVCSHLAACMYLAESITKPGFLSEKCSTWEEYQRGTCRFNEKAYMGFYTERSSQGTYFLKTSSEPPYGSPVEDSIENVDIKTLDMPQVTNELDGELSRYNYYHRSSAYSTSSTFPALILPVVWIPLKSILY